MKVLKPVPLEEVPPLRPGRRSPFEELFQQALSLNGLALPVECDNIREARRIAYSCQVRRGRGRVLGLQGTSRGSTAFLYRRGSGRQA